VRHGLAGGILGDLLGGEGRALARSFETDATGAGPADHVACMSVMETCVLLKVARMLATPTDHILRALGPDDLLAGRLVAQ
jgi:hypothetical protein